MTTMQKLLKIVDDAYPDGMIGMYVDLKTGETIDGCGDTLAQFVARETVEVGAEGTLEERRIAVANALRTAVSELEQVIHSLESMGVRK